MIGIVIRYRKCFKEHEELILPSPPTSSICIIGSEENIQKTVPQILENRLIDL